MFKIIMTVDRRILFVSSVIMAALVITLFSIDKYLRKEPIVAEELVLASKERIKIRPLTNISYESNPVRLARGKYLTTGLLQCFTCHTVRDWNAPGAPPIVGREGSGGTVFYRDSLRLIVAPNITPDNETGAGKWSDDMLTRAIREGVGHHGRALSWQMPSYTFRNLSDEDVASVVVYLRSIPPVHNVVPPVTLPADERKALENNLYPLTKPVEMPDLSDPMKKGKYLVMLGDCHGCHTSHSDHNPGLFAGGNYVDLFGQQAMSANITSNPSGITYGPDAFLFTLRTGKGGLMSPVMPWVAFKNMTDDDLKAIYSYLRTFPSSTHYVSNQKPFTHCAVCGMAHGLGDQNKEEKIARIEMDAAIYDQFVGTYLNEDHNWLYIISKEGNKLMGQQSENGPKTELIPQSELHFRASMWPVAVHFVKDDDGQVTELREDTDLGETYKRVNGLP